MGTRRPATGGGPPLSASLTVLNSEKRERVREVCQGKGRPYTLVYSLASLWRANGP